MKPKSRLYFGLILLLTHCLCSTSLAQNPKPKKKIKDFGQSLKRVQGDPVKQTAVEVAPPPSNKEDPVDVIRIDTRLVTNVVLVLIDRDGMWRD